MGTLAIRQGDVLHFARSLVWVTVMRISADIKNQPVHVRMAEYFKLWEQLKRAGDFHVSQENADLLASLCGVPAPCVRTEDDDDDGLSLGTISLPGRRGRDDDA